MRTLIYLFIGILFGITMFKSEAASWFRIYEMFHFQSFHMYGIMGSALGLGIILVQSIKKFNIKSFYGEKIEFQTKEKGFKRYMFGGILFGLGWALAGACPGPIYTLIGVGSLPMLVVLVSAIFGTFLYGLFKDKLPH
ncbi:MAG: transporter [Lutibacter sp.]|nr:MAG: transporter [Lutibacter sp.]